MSSPAADPAVAHVSLWGSDHPDLGQLAVEALPPATAIALSAGRLPKPYAHLDANEDAVIAAEGPGGTMLAVADGHSGFDAAQAAISAIRERLDVLAGQLDEPADVVDELLNAARQGVREWLAGAAEARRESRTALSIALIAGDSLAIGSLGDTQVLRVRGRRTKVLSGDSPFLEASAPLPRASRARLKRGDAVVVCSDGLRDYLAGGWPDGVAGVLLGRSEPAAAAQGLVEAAWTGGAGDHISVGLTQVR